MKTNFVKLTNLTLRKSLNYSALRAVLMVLLVVLGVGNAWGWGDTYYYAALKVTANPATGAGSVYASTSTTKGTTAEIGATKSAANTKSVAFYIWADANAGYKFNGWTTASGSATCTYDDVNKAAGAKVTVTTTNTSNNANTKGLPVANFVVIEAAAAPANVTLYPTDPSATYPESTDERTLTFTTTSSNKIEDFTYSPANGASGKYTFANWRRVDATHVAVDYTFSGGGNYGGLTRTHQVNVTLKGKEHATTKTCTITATFPNAKIIGGSAEEIYATYKATDATQEGVEKTAVFDVENVDGINNFDTPTFTGTDAARFSLDPTTPMSYADGKLTVKYIYNGNKETTNPTHTATLTLKVNDAIGGTDATYGSKAITITAHNEQEATDDASVTTAAGVTTNYATFVAALAAANASAGSTLTLLRNVDLGTITATNNITKAMTIDLNGKELRAAVNATSVGILTITKAVAVTIKDSKTGGKIINEVARNSEVRTIFVNAAGATLTLESGTIAVNNTIQFRYGVTDHTDGEANVTSCAARAIHQIAGSTININGGKVQSKASRNGYGIYQASNASTQRAGTTVLNISGGEIYSECSNRAYGVAAYGKVNLSGGTITAKLNTETVNANTVYVAYKPDDDSYVVHNYIYALQMNGGASVTAASNYYGELNMTGGEVVAINENVHTTATRSLYIYGIFFNAGSVNVKTGTASDGTYSQKWAAVGDISGGSVRVENAGTLAYGVYVGGEYNSHDDSHTVTKIKNFNIDVTAYQSAYGVYANASVGTTSNSASPNMGACYAGDVELTDVTVNATATDGTTAYALMVVSTYGTVFKNATMTKATDAGYTQVYDGEFASAAKMTVNSGTYTAETKKSSSAYAAASSTRSRTIFSSTTSTNASRELGGHKEAYAELIIHGGIFTATTSTSEARAVSVGGHTTIDGGHFYANAGSSTARGIYCVSGTLTVSGVDVHSEANSSAFGISLSGGISDNTGFSYSADAELNNLMVDVKTRTGNEADGVLMEVTKKNLPTIPTSGEYMNIYQKGEYAIAPKAIINGGAYTVTSQGTSAYGVSLNSAPLCEDINGDGILAIGEGDLTIKNAEFTVKTKTGNAAYGVWAGGKTSVENTKFTITSATSDAYGLRAYYGKSTIKNSKFDVTATTATAVGLRAEARMSTVNGSNGHHTTNFSGVEGYDLVGEIESEGNTVTVRADGGNTAYGIQVISAKGSGTKTTAAAGLAFKGDHACAGIAIVNGGRYTATASGTTAYAVIVSAPATQGEATATPTCIINDGKFKGSATSTYADVNENGVAGYCVLNGGFYTVHTNLAKYIPEGLEEVTLPSDRPEYTEGYRYEVAELGVHGGYVCQIGSNKYRTLEEALQVVTSGQVIYMIDNYNMMTPGDYILPSGTTLLIPYKTGSGAGATTAIGNTASTADGVTPTLFRKLTLGAGVNLSCFGTIETSAQLKKNGQYGANLGMPAGPYGQIHLQEGSHISLEANSRLNCWGYITGQGTIEVKKNAVILEGFQMGDWCGGSNFTTLENNSQKVFPVTHYFYQSIECPVTYRPGSRALGATYAVVSSMTIGQSAIPMVGTSGSMFIMDDNDVSEETWVMKDYNETTDQCVWTINSGASLGNLNIEMKGTVSRTMNSGKYVLPITTNMSIVLNYGAMNVGQDIQFLPGSKLIINKEGTAVLDGVKATVFDVDEWTGTTRYFATYSPTWGTTNPRINIPVADAEMFLHGKVNIKGNGGLYTTASGANIHSTNADAGEVIYTTAAQGNMTTYYLQQGGTTRPSLTVNPAKLKNGDESYASSAGTVAGKTWTYKNDVWDAWTKDGCFFMNAQDKPHAKPAALVELTSKTPDANHLHHDAATGVRNFVWDENCYWWEVSTTPTAEGYYQSLNPDNNGKYNYYEYNSAAGCWKIKTLTVTWSINGNNTNYTVGYGTKPHWLGATPTKTSSSTDYVWRWDGWTKGSEDTVLSNDSLPVVTTETTFTAHFYKKYYQSLVTFKNDDGTVLESKLWNRGSIPSYEGIPTKEATAAQTFEFNESNPWSPAITAVGSSPAEYVAQYTATTRQYNVEFVNYDMSPLGSIKVDYNATPTAATYLEAIAPSTTEPYKPDNNAYSFDFSGWRLSGASSNGFAQVKGDQIYIAQFAPTAKKYLIAFMDDDGETMLHYMQLPYDADIVYDGPAPADFAANKTNDEWCYTFTEWTPVLKAKVDGPQTYTATYKKRSNLVVDITDWSSSQVTLNTTNWALGGWPYTVNGITYYQDKASAGSSTNYRADDRTLAIDYDGDPNCEYRICVQNKNGDLYSLHSYVIPYVYTSSTTLPKVKVSSVIYVNGCSLTIGSATTVEAIYVASNAELIVNSPLTVTKLVLRTKESEAASLEKNSTISATNTYYTRQVSSMAYQQFGLPLGVSSTDDVFLSSHAACPYGKTWLLKSYNEHERASNGMGGSSNWQEVPDKSPIQASVGYEMYSGSAFYREFYFPVDLDEVSTDKKVAVGYTKNASAGDDNAGWNVLCSPLLGKFTQHFDPNNTEDGIKISRWIDGHYEQSAPPVIYPAVPFYYQAKESGKFLYFTGDKMELNISPRKAWNASIPTQWLQLTIHNQYGDRLDETGIYTHPEKFSMNYQSGYDVAKQSLAEGAALLYSELPYGKLAFAAVPDSLAEARIPLTAYAAAEGEYIFSMVESNYLGRLQYVFLHDTQTGLVVDLLERDCAVKLAQGTNAGRFYIQCVFAAEAPEISTGVNHLKSEPNQAQKILYNDKVYIIYQGRVYDMTGRQCELK